MTVQDYLDNIPEDRIEAFNKLRETIAENIDPDFQETIMYKMIAYVVPKSIFPDGYHCDTSLPLPFINIANQKNFIALYHMGLYADEALMDWFVSEYPNHAKRKLDMGKSCVRFKKMDDIPFELIGQLIAKMNVQDWLDIYTTVIRK